jgi:hypothetical protein
LGGYWKHENKCVTHAHATFNVAGDKGFGSDLKSTVAGSYKDGETEYKAKGVYDSAAFWFHFAYIHRFNKQFKLVVGDKVSVT